MVKPTKTGFESIRARGVSRMRGPSFTAVVTHIALFTALCLQRFGIPLGPVTVSISLPVLLLLTTWIVASGRAHVPRFTALMFALFVGWTLLSTLTAVLAPDRRVGLSILSLLELWTLFLPLLVRPSGNFDYSKVQRIVLLYVRVCALCGIVQFGLQFAHIRLFSFVEYLPTLGPWTLESDFAIISPTHYGSAVLRSNGFFLLEPSIFSQVMALGIMLDVFVLERKRYLPLYAIAYLTTYSGTGLLSLGATLLLLSLFSLRNASRTIQVALVAVLALGLFGAVFPSQVATFLARSGELGSNKTSAYARYLAPFAEVQTFAGETRSLLGYGPGATARAESFTAGSSSAALQLFVDYGLVGACLFATFMLTIFWTPQAAALPLFLLINFQLGGAYLLMPPMLLLMMVSGIWSVEQRRVEFRRSARSAGTSVRRTGCFAGELRSISGR